MLSPVIHYPVKWILALSHQMQTPLLRAWQLEIQVTRRMCTLRACTQLT